MGSLAARERGKVAAWEIWNEPDEKDFWHGQVGAAQYAAAPDRRAHRDPRGRPVGLVLAGASTGNDYPFVEGLYAAGAGGSFDGVAVAHRHRLPRRRRPTHYYREADGRVGRFSFLGFREVHNVLEQNGNGDRPIIHDRARLVGDEDALLTRRLGRQEGRRRHARPSRPPTSSSPTAASASTRYVRAALWFTLTDTSAADTEFSRYGLQRADGSRRPAYDALSAVGHGEAGHRQLRRLHGAQPRRHLARDRRRLRPLAERRGRRERRLEPARQDHVLRERQEDPQLHR